MKLDNRWLAAGLAAALTAGPAAVLAKGSSDGSTGAGTAATDEGSASATIATIGDETLANGLQKLHAGNEAEVQFGQLGVQRASSAEVKQFAQQMVDDHSHNDQQLGALAPSLGVTLTGKAYEEKQKEGEKAMNEVQGKSGAAFDKAFMAQMVKDHERETGAVQKLAQRARAKNHPELANFLEQTAQRMQHHLTMARRVDTAASATAKAGGGASTGAGAASADVTNPKTPSSKSAGGVNPGAKDDTKEKAQGTGTSDESASTGGGSYGASGTDTGSSAAAGTGAAGSSGTGASESEVMNPDDPSAKSSGSINPSEQGAEKK
jgi:putative membrane protein